MDKMNVLDGAYCITIMPENEVIGIITWKGMNRLYLYDRDFHEIDMRDIGDTEDAYSISLKEALGEMLGWQKEIIDGYKEELA